MWKWRRRVGDRADDGRSEEGSRTTGAFSPGQQVAAEQSLAGWQRRGLAELGLMTLLFALYYATRGVAADGDGTAFVNAYRVMDLEHRLGMFWELGVQAWALATPTLARALNLVYVYMHLPGLLLFAAWVFRHHHRRYGEIRNVFLVILGSGLLTYILFPVAPPRFFPYSGFIDTLALFSRISFSQPSIELIYNPFAAMPSLHVAFALFCGIGVIRCGGRLRHWLIGLLYPSLMITAVIATGNHYILDAIAGVALTILAYLLVPRLSLPRRPKTHFGSGSPA